MDKTIDCRLPEMVRADRLGYSPLHSGAVIYETYANHFMDALTQSLQELSSKPVSTGQMMADQLLVVSLGVGKVVVVLSLHMSPLSQATFAATLKARIVGPDGDARQAETKLLVLRDSLL